MSSVFNSQIDNLGGQFDTLGDHFDDLTGQIPDMSGHFEDIGQHFDEAGKQLEAGYGQVAKGYPQTNMIPLSNVYCRNKHRIPLIEPVLQPAFILWAIIVIDFLTATHLRSLTRVSNGILCMPVYQITVKKTY